MKQFVLDLAGLSLFVIALICLSVGAQTIAPEALGVRAVTKMVDHDPQYSHVDFTGGVSGDWLRVERHNMNDYEMRGFDPCYTIVRTQFKPIVTKHANEWEVSFVSNLPDPPKP